jgi:LPXTG-site transpeptidase (sortase) family protein
VAVGRAFVASGLLLIAACVGWFVDAHIWQATLAERLRTLDPHAGARWLSGEAGATRREAERSGLVGRIEIPRLGVSTIVVEGTSGRALRRGVGHVERTAFPGERGNVGLAGHRDTYFGALGEIAKGDRVRLVTPDGTFEYRVKSIEIVTPDRVDVLATTSTPTLTLVTCYPFRWVGPAPRRYVIRAAAEHSALARAERVPSGA